MAAAYNKPADAVHTLTGIDPWAAPTTQVFALIGLLWLCSKIFSFWRAIASLFFLPGASVSTRTKHSGRATHTNV